MLHSVTYCGINWRLILIMHGVFTRDEGHLKKEGGTIRSSRCQNKQDQESIRSTKQQETQQHTIFL